MQAEWEIRDYDTADMSLRLQRMRARHRPHLPRQRQLRVDTATFYCLSPTSSMAPPLAEGSMSSNTKEEGNIRRCLIEVDVVECMVALPGQLFTNTQIPACLWFLSKDRQNGLVFDKRKRNCSGEVLFIDARQQGYMKTRVLRDFSAQDSQKIIQTFHNWQYGENYQNEAGFGYSASLEEIKAQEYIFTTGLYVGATSKKQKMNRLQKKWQN